MALRGSPAQYRESTSPKRVIVLGRALVGENLTSYEWGSLPSGLNVSDFDAVVLDLRPLEDPAVARAIDVQTLPPAQQFWRLLFSPNSHLIVVGRPWGEIGDATKTIVKKDQYGESNVAAVNDVLWWAPPGLPQFVREPGQTLEVVAGTRWAPYFEDLTKWEFYADDNHLRKWGDRQAVQAFFDLVSPGANDLKTEVSPIAVNRLRKPLAFDFRLRTIYEDKDRWSFDHSGPRTIATSGRLTILCAPASSGTKEDKLLWLLAHSLKIEASLLASARPEWLLDYLLPYQEQMQDRIAQNQAAIEQLTLAIEEDRKELADSLDTQSVLTATGDDLERLVQSLLQRLGGAIEAHQHNNRDDGRITDPSGRRLILEMKGRQKSIKLEDIRQLRGWIDTAARDEGLSGKGLLVANGYLAERPESRPQIYPDNAVQEAVASHICLMSAPQLLQAVREVELGRLQAQALWDSIFGTDGLYVLPAAAREPSVPRAASSRPTS